MSDRKAASAVIAAYHADDGDTAAAVNALGAHATQILQRCLNKSACAVFPSSSSNDSTSANTTNWKSEDLLAAMLSVPNVFLRPKETARAADEAKQRFAHV